MPEVYARETRVVNLKREELLRLINCEGFELIQINLLGSGPQFVVEKKLNYA